MGLAVIRKMRRYLILILSLVLVSGLSVVSTPRAHAANEMREFLMACTYGVLAGTLVGASTLAFETKPGENLSAVARGASLGLYAGIALGLYVVYYVPTLPPPDESAAFQVHPPRGLLLPILGEHGLEGFRAEVLLTRF